MLPSYSFRRRETEVETFMLHQHLSFLQAHEIVNHANSHTLEHLRELPWIKALGDSVKSTDLRRQCNVKHKCANQGRTTQFCIQCTFITYLGQGAFMVCNSKSCLSKHKETIGSHCSGSKRFKMQSDREELMETRAKTKEVKKAKAREVNKALNLKVKELRQQAKAQVRALNSQSK
jgi:hypothetical protein